VTRPEYALEQLRSGRAKDVAEAVRLARAECVPDPYPPWPKTGLLVGVLGFFSGFLAQGIQRRRHH
jgi:hypothetical protein